jgi:hypothetical protein
VRIQVDKMVIQRFVAARGGTSRAILLPVLIALCLPGDARAESPERPARSDPPQVKRTTNLPTGATVLERFVEVTGGMEAWRRQTIRSDRGTVEFVGMGIESSFATFAAGLCKRYSVSRTEGLGEVEEGCDGTVVWSRSIMLGPQVHRGAVRDYHLRAYRFSAHLHWRELYRRVECVGIVELDGVACYQVAKYGDGTTPDVDYYAVDTGLLVRQDYVAVTAMGEIPTTRLFDDYRAVGDVRVAHHQTVRAMGREQRVTYTKIRFNTKFKSNQFVLPADIRELARRGGFSGPPVAKPAESPRQPATVTTMAEMQPGA